ncbi:MAG: hypothetical protein ACJ70Q_03665 [Nitrososphaera sp.]
MSTFIFLLAIKYNFEPSPILAAETVDNPPKQARFNAVINQSDKDEDGEI